MCDIKERFREYIGNLDLVRCLKLVSVKYPLKKSADEAELEDVAKRIQARIQYAIEPDVSIGSWKTLRIELLTKFGCIFDYCDQTKTGNCFCTTSVFP